MKAESSKFTYCSNAAAAAAVDYIWEGKGSCSSASTQLSPPLFAREICLHVLKVELIYTLDGFTYLDFIYKLPVYFFSVTG